MVPCGILYAGVSRSMSFPPQARKTEAFPWTTLARSLNRERIVSERETQSGLSLNCQRRWRLWQRLARLVLLIEAKPDFQVLLQQTLEEEGLGVTYDRPSKAPTYPA